MVDEASFIHSDDIRDDDVARVRKNETQYQDNDIQLHHRFVTSRDPHGTNVKEAEHNILNAAKNAFDVALKNNTNEEVDIDNTNETEIEDACSDDETDVHKNTGGNSTKKHSNSSTCSNKLQKSIRDADPINEFERNDHAITGSFPDIFLFGKLFNDEAQGHLTQEQCEHILLQFSNVASSSKDLLFFLFNQKQRFQNIKGVNAKVRGNQKAFDEFAELASSKEFLCKLSSAEENPSGKDAKEVIKKVLPILNVSGKRTPFGALERSFAISKMLAMTRRYGPASVFLTIAPDDVNNPTSFRLSFRSISNAVFPAIVDDTFFRALQQNTSFIAETSIPIKRHSAGYIARLKAATDNPIATTLEFKAMLHSVFEILIGLPESMMEAYKVKKTTPYTTLRKGVFGQVIAGYAVIEESDRKSLHTHCLFWGSLSPNVLQAVAAYPYLWDEVACVLDSMYIAEVPRELHIKKDIEKEQRKCDPDRNRHEYNNPAALYDIPTASSSEGSDFQSFVCNSMKRTNDHEHSFTCKKGAQGRVGCRGSKPSGLVLDTRPVQIEFTNDNGTENKTKIIAKIPEEVNIQSSKYRDLFMQPLPEVDSREIVWEIKKPPLDAMPIPNCVVDDVSSWYINSLKQEMQPYTMSSGTEEWLTTLNGSDIEALYEQLSQKLVEANGWMVESNEVLTACLGCNIAAYLLGSTEQSKAALFYLSNYFSKDKAPPEECITVLIHARKEVEKYKSTAEDSGTVRRTAMHWLMRTLNSLNGQMEISDTQAAAANLGMNFELCTDSFSYFSYWDSINYIEEMQKERCNRKPSQDDDTTSIDSSDNEIYEHGLLPSTNSGVTLYVKKGEKPKDRENIPVQDEVHYQYHGDFLEFMNRWEYFSLIKVVEKKKEPNRSNQTKRRGRQVNRKFPFHPDHPLYESHQQVLLSKQHTILFTGPKIPTYPGSQEDSINVKDQWERQANRFAKFVLVTFMPSSGTEKDNTSLDWNEMCSWIHGMVQNNSHFDRALIAVITNTVFGFNSSFNCRQLLSIYKGRNKTIWSEEEKKLFESNVEIQGSLFNAQEHIDDYIKDGEFYQFTSQSAKRNEDSLKYVHKQMEEFEQCILKEE